MKKICLIILPILSGCAVYGEQFDCGPGMGVSCKSLTAVNHMVEVGDLPLNAETPLVEGDTSPKPDSLRIWMNGYEDATGNFHNATTLEVPMESQP